MSETPLTTKIVRKVLGLPTEAPSRTPYTTEEIKEGPNKGYIRMSFKEGEERDREVNAYYAEGARGDLADTISDWINPHILLGRSKRKLKDIKNTIRDKKIRKKLKSAKRLTFRSPYIIEPDHPSVEGWIYLEDGSSLGMTIVSATRYVDYVKLVEENDEFQLIGNVVSNKTTTDMYGNWIFVSDELSDEAIQKAIQGWYKDIYEFQRINRDYAPEVTVEIERPAGQCESWKSKS